MKPRSLGFIVSLTLALLVAPLAAPAPSPGKVYRIGFLGLPSAADIPELVAAFRHGLRDLGYEEGRIARLNIVGRRGAMIVFRRSPPNWFGSRST